MKSRSSIIIALFGSVVGLVQPASGEVVMFDLVPDLTMGPQGINTYNVDINADGIRDVRMLVGGGTTGFRVAPDAHVRVQGEPDDPGSAFAWRIANGSQIGPAALAGADWMHDPPNSGLGLTSCVVFIGLTCFGNFNLQQGYIGLETTLPDGIHYGWIDVQGYLGSGDVRGWAYETQPGVPITAPEPSRLLLVLVGLSAWIFRRRRALGSG